MALPPLKTVHQMAVDGDEPPPKYILKNNPFGGLDSSPAPLAPIPVIDFTLLSPSSSQQQQTQELAKLLSALSSWGCFQVVNHGISNLFLDKMREVTKHFFALPIQEKRKYAKEAASAEWYGVDTVVSEEQVLDWCDRLSLRVIPEDQRKPHLWPKSPVDFRNVGGLYHEDSVCIGNTIWGNAKSLNSEENTFSRYFEGRSIMQGRLILYSPCPRPDQVFGLKAHSDRSRITVLLQDREVEGLQVFNGDKWFMVPVIPHALFVNLGDQTQIMSNGIFKSPLHRVVTKEREKISVAIFNEPEPDREIGPVDGLVDEERPRLYKTVKNYGVFNYECFQKGVVALDAARI